MPIQIKNFDDDSHDSYFITLSVYFCLMIVANLEIISVIISYEKKKTCGKVDTVFRIDFYSIVYYQISLAKNPTFLDENSILELFLKQNFNFIAV